MDIEALDTVNEDEGTFIQFKDAAKRLMWEGTGEDRKPIGAVVSGTYSQYYRDAFRKQREQAVLRSRDRARDEDVDVAAVLDQIDGGGYELEVACIRSWTFTSAGQPLPITVRSWKAMLAKQPQWQDQVSAAMQDHARFFGAS